MAERAVPGYTELKALGSGGFGDVVLARHDASGTLVAIKYLRRNLLSDPGFAQGFRAEAAVLSSLDDANVVRLYEYVESPDGAAIVMELIDGVSLREILANQGATTPEAALVVLQGSLLGLAAAHRRGVVHRDYKPENVLVNGDGASKLADFGIAARAGDKPAPQGTLKYAPPEQFAGVPARPAADVYAATATFYECLTGRPPFSGDTDAALLYQHLSQPVPLDPVPEPLRPLVAAGMAKDPGRRPADASTFVTELRTVASRAYGPGWEARGRSRLGEAALLLAALWPSGAAPAVQGAAVHRVSLHRSSPRRHLPRRRASMVKAATAAGVAVAVAAVAVAVLSRPSGPGRAAASATTPVAAPAPAVLGWPQLHDGPDRAGYQPDETRIGTGNAARLSQARTYHANSGLSAPLIANGILYVATNYLYAFDATGAARCSAAPTACTPLWTAPTAYFDGMTIADGDVFVTDAEGVQAYDAGGSKNCSGTPKVCHPLWDTSTHFSTGPAFEPGPGWPVVANGVLYVPGYGDGLTLSTGGAYVAAFDVAGKTGCSGSPVVCGPMWTTTGLPASSGNTGSPAIADGVIYIANQTLYAFDATGSANCSGTPKVCAPLWTAATAGYPTYSAPAVADGTVYVGSWGSKLYAFSAAGSVNCSAAPAGKTCTPLWTAATPSGIGGTPAVAHGVVYAVSADGTLSAFDAAGSRSCSGTVTAKTCTPLWSSAPRTSGYVTKSSPAVANGIVYFSSTNGGTYAYDAAGSLDCSTTPTGKTCAPLWGAVTGFIGGGSPAIVNGVLYINVSGDGTIYAYSL
jgi:serine/threonine-protein kinase